MSVSESNLLGLLLLLAEIPILLQLDAMQCRPFQYQRLSTVRQSARLADLVQQGVLLAVDLPTRLVEGAPRFVALAADQRRRSRYFLRVVEMLRWTANPCAASRASSSLVRA